jgi:carbonic anhydrase
MAKKASLDQTTAWIIAVLTSGAIFGGGYALLNRFAKSAHGPQPEFDVRAMEDPDSAVGHETGSDHGKQDSHGEKATHGEKGSHDEHGASDHGTATGEHESPSHEASDEPHGEGEKEHAASPAEHKEPAHGAKGEHHSSAGKDPHWGYDGENGPEMWGKLAPNFVDCQDGRTQSPINFESATVDHSLRPLQFSYISGETRMENNGHTIGQKFGDGNYLTFNGNRFGLVGFHFHAPSEHTVGGVPYEMEMHLVHKDARGNLAVVGVFLEESDVPNKEFDTVLKSLPNKPGSSGPEIEVNPLALLPAERGYFAYKGSLTTPPCSEGVQWLVLRKSVRLSSKQIDAFTQLFSKNARPTQPVFSRKVNKSASS